MRIINFFVDKIYIVNVDSDQGTNAWKTYKELLTEVQ